ncbi:MAG: hypothetical protein KGL58_00555, partial [Pseudomonadota bacterium]|nr:hypothetical protein [Pseudomonadota bacterium]
MKFLLWLFLLGFTQPILASGEHDAWAGAKSAYARQDSVLLTRYASALRNYPLYPYIQYWQLRLDWDSLTNAQVMNYVDSNQISVLSQKLLGDWLKKLGHDQDYKTFRRDYVQLLNPDTEIVCDDLDAHLTESKDDVLEHGVRLWLSPYSRPSSCLPVFNALFSEKGNYPLVWERLRLALDNGQVALAQFIIDHFLNNADKRRMAGLRSVLRDPIAFLENRRVKVGAKPDRILLRFALFQAYDKHPKRTLKVWKKLQYRLNRADRQGIWAGIALRAARNHDKTAVRYFDQAGRHLTQEELAWQARSALLEGDWQLVRYSIHEMPPGMEAHSEWRYWLARSDLKLGETVKAREKLVGIAHGLGYFSLLAREDLGKKLSW